jgi:hypothetical protein
LNEFSISRDISQPWPAEVLTAASAFRQGDIVARPPFFYAANSEYPVWGFTKEAAEAGDDRELLEFHEDDRPEFGIITTQSCDLTEEGAAKPKKPWLQVAPLVDARVLGHGLARDVAKGKVKYLFLVPAPDLAGEWVADLRIEVPLEKSWLVGRTPMRGFPSLEEYQQFTRRLGQLRARAAIESGVCMDLWSDLRTCLTTAGSEDPDVLDGVGRVMLRVIGERANPSAVQLVVVSAADRPDDAVKAIFERWYDDFNKFAFERGVALLPISYQSRFTPDEYERLVMLDLDDLSPDDT